MGLNTFTPQPSTADFHQRGYEIYGQHRYITGSDSALTSQLSYKRYDADVTAISNDPYQLLIDTTEGGFFNRQARRTYRLEWAGDLHFRPAALSGHTSVESRLELCLLVLRWPGGVSPVTIIGASGAPIEQISFTAPTSFSIDQNETSWFVADQWTPFSA